MTRFTILTSLCLTAGLTLGCSDSNTPPTGTNTSNTTTTTTGSDADAPDGQPAPDKAKAEPAFKKAEGLLANNRVEKGVAMLDEAIYNDPDHVPALLTRGELQLKYGNPQGGLDDIARVLEIETRNQSALLARAAYYEAKFAESQDPADKALLDADMKRVQQLQGGVVAKEVKDQRGSTLQDVLKSDTTTKSNRLP